MNETINIEATHNISKKIYFFTKRLFDILVSVIGLIFLLISAIIIKLIYLINKDFSSIFYSQKRIGKNGRIFNLYKFRSMVPNADDKLKEILKNPKYKKEWDLNQKLENDPRITKLGKIIRKTSIDELPQFINIIRGDMSLIGNRPYLPREKSCIGYYFDEITSTKPGLTGYWQTSGRSNTTFNERLTLEKYYSENCSLSFDIKIFFKTIFVVLFEKGSK